jgi:hypothetical protein
MIPATDEVHAVLAIHGYPGHVPVRIAFGQLFPSLYDCIIDSA